MNRKIRILLATENQNDITAWLRSIGPFTCSPLSNYVELVRCPVGIPWSHDWSYFMGIDFVYFHRACTQRDTEIIERAKTMGAQVWVDHDDDLESVTVDNPMYKQFSGKANRDAIIHSIKEADILTVGGIRHKERLEKEYGVKPIRLYNALSDMLLSLRRPWKENGKIAWRGSQSHTADLLFYGEPISTVLENNKSKFSTRFFGLCPYWYDWMEIGFKWEYAEPTNLIEFFGLLAAYNANFHFVPLIDNEFNRVKSNIAFLDATLAGSVTLGPNFEEFRVPGCKLYDATYIDFQREFQNLLNLDKKQCEMHLDAAWTWIMENQILSKVNVERMRILGITA